MSHIELDFTLPNSPGFCHLKNELYLVGGSKEPKYLNDFTRINSSGKVAQLESLPTGKSYFPMTYW